MSKHPVGRRPARSRFVIASALCTISVLVAFTPSVAGEGSVAGVPVLPELEAVLTATPDGEPLLVLVTADTTLAAVDGVEAAGLTKVEVFDRLAVVAAAGVPDAVRAVHEQPGVRRVDANLPLQWLDEVAHRAAGVAQLRDLALQPELRRLRRRDGTPYDGSGVSIAVVDSGFDTTHEQFVDDGESKFGVHLRQACPVDGEDVHLLTGTSPVPECSLWVPASPSEDGDDGHGTAVAAFAAGYERTTPGGVPVAGAAPGARLVGLSVGGPGRNYNGLSALNWVLEHHGDPCGDRSCPPIRVVNNSWGVPYEYNVTSRGFETDNPISRATAALVEAGVVVVFAAGNSGSYGEGGSVSTMSPYAMHPLPGVLSVGMYHDGNSGDRDYGVSSSSSRGLRGAPSTYPDLVAPGAYIMTACPLGTDYTCIGPSDGAYVQLSGTSLAAPHVAGVVAVLLEASPSLTPAQVEDVLEDSAYQGFIDAEDLEPDVYWDPEATLRGNEDHQTSFHAGHGLLDAVGSLSTVLGGARWLAPEPCPGRDAEATVLDPPGDTKLYWVIHEPSPTDQPSNDITAVTTRLHGPDALEVVVAMADVPQVTERTHLTVQVTIDGEGAEVDLERSLTGDEFRPFRGDVDVEGRVDPESDTVTFVIRPLDGGVSERGGLVWAWTSNGRGEAEVDHTAGLCPVWLPES